MYNSSMDFKSLKKLLQFIVDNQELIWWYRTLIFIMLMHALTSFINTIF